MDVIKKAQKEKDIVGLITKNIVYAQLKGKQPTGMKAIGYERSLTDAM